MNFRIWKVLFWLILIIIIFLPSYSKIQQLNTTDKELSSRLESLESENKRLSEEIELLKSDPVYIEEVARKKLKVARENEIIYRVIDNEEE